MKNPLLKTKYQSKWPNSKYRLRNLLEEIIYVLETGLAWRNIRSQIHWFSVYQHFRFLSKHKIFRKLFYHVKNKYIKKSTPKFIMIDSSFVPNKGGRNSLARNKFYKGKRGNKISIVTDHKGVPLSVILMTGNRHDNTPIKSHLRDIKSMIRHHQPKYLLGDKGYGSLHLRGHLCRYHLQFMIPKKKNQKANYYHFDYQIYRSRIRIEHAFQKIKAHRRCQLRYDHLISNFHSWVFLACAKAIVSRL